MVRIPSSTRGGIKDSLTTNGLKHLEDFMLV